MYTSSIILALLTALSMAAPAPSEDFALVPRAQKIPDKVKAPKEGQCLLVVFSSTVLPIGGAPTTVNGAGIAPSLVGEEQAAVINHNKDIIGGPVNLAHMSPGFRADIKMNNGKTIKMSAQYIFPAKSPSWGLAWEYDGKKGQGPNNPACEQYLVFNGGLSGKGIHTCPFDC